MHRMLGVVLGFTVLMSSSRGDEVETSSPRVTVGVNDYLLAGAEAIRASDFDEGIRLTLIALERGPLSTRERAAGLGNVCAGYVSKNEPDKALPFCDESLLLDANNWRVYTARSQAYLVKGMLIEARRDNEAAAAINPNAAHVKMIRGKLNERQLQPHVIMEDHR
jgi:hypothetical protein